MLGMYFRVHIIKENDQPVNQPIDNRLDINQFQNSSISLPIYYILLIPVYYLHKRRRGTPSFARRRSRSGRSESRRGRLEPSPSSLAPSTATSGSTPRVQEDPRCWSCLPCQHQKQTNKKTRNKMSEKKKQSGILCSGFFEYCCIVRTSKYTININTVRNTNSINSTLCAVS